jgi:hypothetical protein
VPTRTGTGFSAGTPGENIYDELAFTVSRLSWTTLANPSFDEALLVDNAEGIYDSLQAAEIVSKWIRATLDEAASGNRPVQPNTIAHEHNGNCGEPQDLLS